MKNMGLSLVLAFSLGLSGCGGGGSSDSNSSASADNSMCINATHQYYFEETHVSGICGTPVGDYINAFILSLTQDSNCVITDDGGNTGIVSENNIHITQYNSGQYVTIDFDLNKNIVQNATIRIKDGLCVLNGSLDGHIY